MMPMTNVIVLWILCSSVKSLELPISCADMFDNMDMISRLSSDQRLRCLMRAV